MDKYLIKKYANRRLYDTVKSCYITLEDIAELIHNDKDFYVQDVKTKEDITRQILTQIILEEENKGNSFLPISFLQDMIKFYHQSIPPRMPDYWQKTMDVFKSHQEKMRQGFSDAMEHVQQPFSQIQEATQKNQEFLQKSFAQMTSFMRLPLTEHEDNVTLTKKEYSQLLEKISSLQQQLKAQ